MDRRRFLGHAGASVLLGASLTANTSAAEPDAGPEQSDKRKGNQRLTLAQLREWEKLQYGMFIHFGMSTYVAKELPDGTAPASVYAPDKLDVDQWVSVARDAGMKYAVLTAKHVAGHCLWPSKHTDYTVERSSDTTDVVEAFVQSCERRGVKPGLYYCSWDNHNRFGSRTPSDGTWNGMNSFPKGPVEELPPFTTSLYHHFQTAQLTELLDNYGPLFEIWIDIPGVLGRGYRTYLYNYLGQRQSDIVIMMNSGFGDGTAYNIDYAWPSDLIAIERDRPPEAGHQAWRTIENRDYYVPAEHCDPIGKAWFFVSDDLPREDAALLEQYESTIARHTNLLLNVPPDKHGLIPKQHVEALMRLRKNARI
jgi:alpha-L-fucosidase